MVACCRLLRAVGRAVATHHVGRGVSEQVLHVEFAGIVCDGPRRECVAEAMRVHFRHFCATTQAAEHLLEPVRSERGSWLQLTKVAGRYEERTRSRSPPLEVALQRGATVRCKGHHALLVALAVAYAQPACLEVEVIGASAERALSIAGQCRVSTAPSHDPAARARWLNRTPPSAARCRLARTARQCAVAAGRS